MRAFAVLSGLATILMIALVEYARTLGRESAHAAGRAFDLSDQRFGHDFGITFVRLVQFGLMLILIAGIVWAVLVIVASARRRFTTQIVHAENGVFPMIVRDLATLQERMTGIRRVAVLPLNNVGVQALTMTVANGMVATHTSEPWGEASQLSLSQSAKRTQLTSVAMPMMTGGTVKNKAQAFVAAGGDPAMLYGDKRGKAGPVIDSDNVTALPSLPVRRQPPTLTEGLSLSAQSEPTKFVIGYDTETNEEFSVSLRQYPHFRVHGGTGSGKSVMLQWLMCQMLVNDFRVILFDRRGLKSFGQFSDSCQLVDTADSANLVYGLSTIVKEHDRRDKLLGRHGAEDIDDLGRMTGRTLPRIGIVIDEWTLQAIYAKEQGHWHALRNAVEIISSQGRSSGIHMLFADQKPTEWWDARMKINVGGVLSGKAPRYQGRGGGYGESWKLKEYEFAFADTETKVKTWETRTAFDKTRSYFKVQAPPVLVDFAAIADDPVDRRGAPSGAQSGPGELVEADWVDGLDEGDVEACGVPVASGEEMSAAEKTAIIRQWAEHRLRLYGGDLDLLRAARAECHRETGITRSWCYKILDGFIAEMDGT